jgi:Tol biopolymer transport system component/C-terminal processing protease CtpA/Prc
MYSPDGRKLAFVSTRTGNGDIYVLNFATGELKRITFDDGLDQLDNWSRDGKFLYFSSTARDIAGMNDVYRVSAEGGTPMPVSADRYANEYFSAPAPNGLDLAITARGITSQQWWRKGHSHIDESEIYVVRNGSYERLSDGQSKELWPMWSADGKQLFYMSDRGGAENIWKRGLAGAPSQLTHFTSGRVLWPSIAYDGREIVFERDFGIWKIDTASGQPKPVQIELRGAPAGAAAAHLSLTTGFTDLALSRDGKKVAFIVHGEVFAASSKDGGTASRLTQTAANESQIVWAPDDRRLVYVSDRDGTEHLFVYDFKTGSETQLTRGKEPDNTPLFSPDGKLLAYFHDGKELHVLDSASKADRVVATGYFDRPPAGSERALAWSPDSRWIAFTTPDARYFRNVRIVAAAGGESKPASFLANVFGNDLSWSPDGKFLLFDTGQRTEATSIARLDLIPRTPRFREDQFRDLFREETPKSSPPPSPATTPPAPAEPLQPNPIQITPTQTDKTQTEPRPPGSGPTPPASIVFEDIRLRLKLLPVGVDVDSQVISPDGKTVLLTASAARQQNLYTYSLDELAKEPPVARQLTSTPGRKTHAQWSPDGKEVFYLEAGKITVMPIESRVAKPLAVTAEMDVNFAEEKKEVFRQAWSYLNDNFYDAEFHGVNWSSLRQQYSPLVDRAQTPDELRRIVSLMIGELNSSHSGISAGLTANQPATGRLGLRFDRAEYETAGRLKVTEVITLSPAALAGIKPGDYLTAVDGKSLGRGVNLDELLEHKIDRRVMLRLDAREVAVLPVNATTEKGLLYRQWVESNRQYVNKISNGRLGYVHLFDMGSNSLDQLFLDLDAENHSREGVVVDVRNNNGGFVNAYALDFLSRQGYLNMTFRGLEAAPARTILGQRSLERPTVLVVNQHSLSDAEDFTEGYRTLKLGKVVGEPTAGWIIYTGGAQLIDGSALRLPRIRITANDGSNMENHPRPVDVPVLRPIGESYTGHDSQLDKAVQVLLDSIRVAPHFTKATN